MVQKRDLFDFSSLMAATRSISLCLAACLVLGACATQPISPEKASHYRRVGVLSAMGVRFDTTTVGVTVFQNEAKSESFDFGADNLMSEKAIQALSTKYTAVDLSRYRSAFLATPKTWPGTFAESHPTVPEVVRDLMGAEALDAYILLTPGSASVRGTNQGIGGIGIVKREDLFGHGGFWFHVAYNVSVIDGKDYSLVATMPALPVGQSAPFTLGLGREAPIGAPFLHAWSELWRAPTVHKAGITNMFDQLMDRSIPETLRRAALLN